VGYDCDTELAILYGSELDDHCAAHTTQILEPRYDDYDDDNDNEGGDDDGSNSDDDFDGVDDNDDEGAGNSNDDDDYGSDDQSHYSTGTTPPLSVPGSLILTSILCPDHE